MARLHGDRRERLQWAFYLAAQDAGESVLRNLYLKAQSSDLKTSRDRADAAAVAAQEMADYIALRDGAFDASAALWAVARRDGYLDHVGDALVLVGTAMPPTASARRAA